MQRKFSVFLTRLLKIKRDAAGGSQSYNKIWNGKRGRGTLPPPQGG